MSNPKHDELIDTLWNVNFCATLIHVLLVPN